MLPWQSRLGVSGKPICCFFGAQNYYIICFMAHKEHLSWSSRSSFSICVGCNGPRESNDIGGGREIMHSVPFPTVITGCLTLHRPFVLTCSALVLSALVNNLVLHEPLVAWPNDLPAEQVCNILLDRGDLSYRANKG